MAYVTLLSLVPSIAVSFSLLNYFLPKEQTQEIVDRLREILFSRLTEGAGEGALDKLQSMIDGLDPGAMGLTGFAGLTVSLILLLRQIEMSFNQIWRCNFGSAAGRTFFKSRPRTAETRFSCLGFKSLFPSSEARS